MALIKLGSIVAGISGKIGGAVFSRNKGGSYIRTWAKPTNPSTDGQILARQRMTSVSGSWRSLSKAQRQSWVDVAATRSVVNRMGEPSYLTGFQYFVKLNLTALTLGIGEIVDAPAPRPLIEVKSEVETFDLTPVTGSVVVRLERVDGQPTLTEDSERVILRGAVPTPKSQKLRNARIIGVFSNNSTEVTEDGNSAVITLTPEQYTDIFGPLNSGFKTAIVGSATTTEDPWESFRTIFPESSVHEAPLG